MNSNKRLEGEKESRREMNGASENEIGGNKEEEEKISFEGYDDGSGEREIMGEKERKDEEDAEGKVGIEWKF